MRCPLQIRRCLAALTVCRAFRPEASEQIIQTNHTRLLGLKYQDVEDSYDGLPFVSIREVYANCSPVAAFRSTLAAGIIKHIPLVPAWPSGADRTAALALAQVVAGGSPIFTHMIHISARHQCNLQLAPPVGNIPTASIVDVFVSGAKVRHWGSSATTEDE